MSRRVSNEPEDMGGAAGFVATLALSCIRVNEEENLRRYDPKKIGGLADSIRKNGLLQNLIVSELPESELNGDGYTHILRAAYRRYAALKLIEESGEPGRAPDMDEVPVVVIAPDADPQSINMTENGQREEVDYISKATGAVKRIEAGVAAGKSKAEMVKEVAEDLGCKPGYVHELLPILTLRPVIQKRVAAGEIPFKLLKYLPGLTEEQQDAALLDLESVGKGLSTVTEVSERARAKTKKKNKAGQGRKKKAAKGDGDSDAGPISGKRTMAVIGEATEQVDAMAKAEGATAEEKDACKEAKGILKVFAKVLSGSLGGQALGKQLTKRMTEE